MEAILVNSVHNSLGHFMIRNAIFVCERLCTEFPSEINLQLLAGCYLQNNQAYAAYHILKGTRMGQSRYIFALACFKMDLISEAEAALLSTNEPGLEVPNTAASHYLLGLIYRYTDRRKSAVYHFKQALFLDPLFWAAYEELCIMGSAENAAVVFGERAAAALAMHKQQLHVTSQDLFTCSEDRAQVYGKSSEDASPRQLKSIHSDSLKDVSGSYQRTVISSGAINQPPNCASSSFSFYCTPAPSLTSQLSAVAPPPVVRNVQQILAPASSESSLRSTVNTTLQAPRRKFVDEGKFRKISGRLFSDSGPRRCTRLAGEGGGSTNTSAVPTANGASDSTKYSGSSRLNTAGSHSVSIRKGLRWASNSFEEGICDGTMDGSILNAQATIIPSSSSDSRSAEHDGGVISLSMNVHNDDRIHSGALQILGLLRLFGEGFRLSCMYKCQEALDVYQKLPPKHYCTGWVLSQVGISYFELVDYVEADRAFSHARNLCPYRLDGMDVYSTVLYHLKEDMRLSYLAQELLSTDRLAPQTWCAMGNCYSLQKDHDTAARIFQRAIQLNSRFAYAHTLCGHEHVALEDFENGIKSFQSALRADPRHYNAWYGLGMVYLRQEKFEFAEHHFRMAFQLNPSSSVIMSFLGTTLHALKRNKEALMMLENAIVADRKNPLPMFQKAVILSSMDDYNEALEVLKELKEYAPLECSIYALMGTIYKQKNKYDKAMLNFGLALDLKPSAADVATIKAAIEKLLVPDDLDDSLD